MNLREQITELALRYDGCNKGDNAHAVIVAAYNTIRPLPRGYTLKATDSYCAAFVSALAQILRLTCIPFECGAREMAKECNDLGIIRDTSYVPKQGDLIFFQSSHVGIVLSCDGTSVRTIEGNINGGQTGQREYALTDGKILCYAEPDYEDEPAPIPADFPFTGVVQTTLNLRTSPQNRGPLNYCNIESPTGSQIRHVLYTGEQVKIIGESGNWWQTEIVGRYTWTPWCAKTANGRETIERV